MIKTPDVVLEILHSSEIALEAMRSGFLNLSAYADQIHSQVEEKTLKPVRKATIVVALSRIAKNMERTEQLRPEIIFDEISIKSPLVDITLDKTRDNVELLRSLPKTLSSVSFLTQTEGINEVTIIASEDAKNQILAHFKDEPKVMFTGLVGVSVKFSERYISQPNIIYAVLAMFAGKRINLIEIVSTFTELTLLIKETDLEKVIQALNVSFSRSNQSRI